jgi:diguanylate cyclase (GGDEF)-like protein
MNITHTPREQFIILLVDDDPLMRTMMRKCLEGDGYQFLEADNGEDALAIFLATPPDLVLMDALMPGLDGVETCTRIKRLPQGENTPVLMITGQDNRQSVDQAFAAGASDFVTKPVRWAVLRQRTRLIVRARRAERLVEQVAYNDVITTLPNRRFFIDSLARALSRAERSGNSFAVLLLQIDRYRNIVEQMGHELGDELLEVAANRLQSVIRKSDLVAHLEGPEYAILLEDLRNEADVVLIAENILTNVCGAARVAHRDVNINLHLGIAIYPNDGKDLRTLLRHAEIAMYFAKNNAEGPHYRFYGGEVEIAAKRRLALEETLPKAYAGGELVLMLWPRVDLTTGETVGHTARVAWNHPTLGEVDEEELVVLAENVGQIFPLWEWTVRRACQHWREHPRQGNGTAGPRINLPIHNHVLRQVDLLDLFAAIIKEQEVPASAFEFSLDEAHLRGSSERVLEDLTGLERLGVRLAVRRFGVGGMPLSFLHRLEIQSLILDPSLAQEVGRADPRLSALIGGIAGLARPLGIVLVADGISRNEQREALRALGCHLGQGPLFGAAAAAD